MDNVFDLSTLIFLIIAVFFFLQLRRILGRRTGHERQRHDPFSSKGEEKSANNQGDDRVIQMPKRSGARDMEDAALDTEVLEKFAPADSPLFKGLESIMRADRSFDADHFISGCLGCDE